MTSVRDLLEIPELRLRVRTGEDLLDRGLTRIYGTELPDPSRYLSAGELVLSGLLWWRGPEDAEPFVAALAEAGSAALAASAADTGRIPAALVEACGRYGIPLLEVPADLSFAVVTERVVLALAGASAGRSRLRTAAAGDASLTALLEHARAELGAPCWVLSATGRMVAGSGVELVDTQGIARAFVRGGCRARVTNGYTLLPVGERATVPWALAIEGDRARWTGATGSLAAELAALVDLDRSRSEQVRRVADRVAAPLLRLAAGDSLTDTDFTTGLAAAGLPGHSTIRVVLARTGTGTPSLGVALLTELLAGYPARTLVGEAGEDACALVVGDLWPPDWAGKAVAALSTVDSLIPASRVLLGIGGPAAVTELRGASEQARHAVAVAEGRPGRIGVVSGDQLRAHQLLVAAADADLRRSLRARTLGPLLAYDQAQNADLVRTVRVFLDCDASPTAAAKALHVHVNTLRYRITRAGELLGMDLTDFGNQVDVYLALRMSP
ncbi:PucR family transcriptional regulator [Amycolatopsis antarctica]|uniref:PucR family transcriptional regulator n=1 Tax=Amycolatopsis antarctica TaxID=1854586 RepID=A0A263D6G2_9PSEU|nr:PucR family transcriptional regulator ligand-binding domain-containing protein [Amycolatopsis antarctica]OZM74104.1 PucR family transcriptional regulator [Amycolatopsis antarctica]